mmetsp:Transcript_7070/g.13336  ORF Transcript_7070/g.13336 Transcript_7070/m.13336 type:complete len:101 (-) Transcript_7070:195-497(-)
MSLIISEVLDTVEEYKRVGGVFVWVFKRQVFSTFLGNLVLYNEKDETWQFVAAKMNIIVAQGITFIVGIILVSLNCQQAMYINYHRLCVIRTGLNSNSFK